MLNKIMLLAFSSLFLISCADSPSGDANKGNLATTTEADLSNRTAVGKADDKSNSNSDTNANSDKPVEDNSPKRIAFSKGANWGSENLTLAANTAKLFVVSARSGQTMEVETSSKDVSVNLRKGKAETTEDFGFLNAELLANGDYVFEVRNNSKKEIKTSVKVTINSALLQRGVLNDVDEENGNNN